MTALTPLKLVTANIQTSPISANPLTLLLTGNQGQIPPDIIAFQEVVAAGLAGTDVTIANPKTSTDANGFPGNWTTVFVRTLDETGKAFGHALCVRNASGITVVSAKSTEITNLPPADKEPRKLLTTVLKTREGFLFTVKSTHLSWAGTANSTTTKNNLAAILAAPGPQIVMGDMNTAWKYVSEIATNARYQFVPTTPAVTCYEAIGTFCLDYILCNFGQLVRQHICSFNATGDTDHLAVSAELISSELMTDKTGGLPHSVPGIPNRAYEDTLVA